MLWGAGGGAGRIGEDSTGDGLIQSFLSPDLWCLWPPTEFPPPEQSGLGESAAHLR